MATACRKDPSFTIPCAHVDAECWLLDMLCGAYYLIFINYYFYQTLHSQQRENVKRIFHIRWDERMKKKQETLSLSLSTPLKSVLVKQKRYFLLYFCIDECREFRGYSNKVQLLVYPLSYTTITHLQSINLHRQKDQITRTQTSSFDARPKIKKRVSTIFCWINVCWPKTSKFCQTDNFRLVLPKIDKGLRLQHGNNSLRMHVLFVCVFVCFSVVVCCVESYSQSKHKVFKLITIHARHTLIVGIKH